MHIMKAILRAKYVSNIFNFIEENIKIFCLVLPINRQFLFELSED